MSKKVMKEHMKERFGIVNHYCRIPPLPQSLNIELNNTCNQKCVFCPYHGEYAINKVEPAALSIEFVKKILRVAWEKGIGKKEIGFYLAGEVFLYKDLIEVIKYSKQLGFSYTFITTNGTLANYDKIDALIDAGLDSIRFSVNAGDSETYRMIHKTDDFEIVKKNIEYIVNQRNIRNSDLAISLSCVVTKKTQYVIEDVKKVFGDLVDDILFIPIILSGLKDIEEMKREYQIYEDSDTIDESFVCPMLFDTMYINAFGKVVPCCDAYHDDVEFYDLKKELDLVKAWECDKYKLYRSFFLDGVSDEGTICEKCILRRKGIKRFSIDSDF